MAASDYMLPPSSTATSPSYFADGGTEAKPLSMLKKPRRCHILRSAHSAKPVAQRSLRQRSSLAVPSSPATVRPDTARQRSVAPTKEGPPIVDWWRRRGATTSTLEGQHHDLPSLRLL